MLGELSRPAEEARQVYLEDIGHLLQESSELQVTNDAIATEIDVNDEALECESRTLGREVDSGITDVINEEAQTEEHHRGVEQQSVDFIALDNDVDWPQEIGDWGSDHDDNHAIVLVDAANPTSKYQYQHRLGRGRFACVDKFERLFNGEKRQKIYDDCDDHHSEMDDSSGVLSSPLDSKRWSSVGSSTMSSSSPRKRTVVALKRMDICNGMIEERMAKERDIMSSLRHPNVVRLLGSFVTSRLDEFVLIMPVYDCTLSDLVGGWQGCLPLPTEYFRSISFQLLSGLAYLHSCKIIHRDIKSNNILIDTHTTRLVITDFGVSKRLSESHIRVIEQNRRRLMKLLISNNCAVSSALSSDGSSSSSIGGNGSRMTTTSGSMSTASDSHSTSDITNKDQSDAVTVTESPVSSAPSLASTTIAESAVSFSSAAHSPPLSSSSSAASTSGYGDSYSSMSGGHRRKQQFTQQMVIPGNRAPELLLGCHVYDYGIDVWAAACVLSRLVRRDGAMLFEGNADIVVLSNMRSTLGGDFLLFGIGVFEYLSGTFGSAEKADRTALFPGLEHDSNGITLLDSMLRYHPCQRVTADDALKSVFFRDYHWQALDLSDCLVSVPDSPLEGRSSDIESDDHSRSELTKMTDESLFTHLC